MKMLSEILNYKLIILRHRDKFYTLDNFATSYGGVFFYGLISTSGDSYIWSYNKVRI